MAWGNLHLCAVRRSSTIFYGETIREPGIFCFIAREVGSPSLQYLPFPPFLHCMLCWVGLQDSAALFLHPATRYVFLPPAIPPCPLTPRRRTRKACIYYVRTVRMYICMPTFPPQGRRRRKGPTVLFTLKKKRRDKNLITVPCQARSGGASMQCHVSSFPYLVYSLAGMHRKKTASCCLTCGKSKKLPSTTNKHIFPHWKIFPSIWNAFLSS